MSVSAPAVVKKLAAVFGVDAKLTATYTDQDVTFTDGTTSLKVAVTDDIRVAPGVYNVTFDTGETLEQTLADEQPQAPAAAEKQAKPAARQSPSCWDEARVF